jgi:hypothetical protein
MPQQSVITLETLLAEQERIQKVMLKHYPQKVKAGELTHYEKDLRLACNYKMITLLKQAIENKQHSHKPKLLQLLKNLQR